MIKRPEGTYDILPDEAKFWQRFCEKARRVFGRYGYSEIITPIMEQTDLFVRGIGEATDVVNKEMFKAVSGGNIAKLQAGEHIRSKSDLTLRPEGTASVVRSVIQNGLVQNGEAPAKLLYMGPMFRAERPQQGRYRQFLQVGVECIGATNPTVDSEAIIMLMQFYEALGFDIGRGDLELVINSMGCKDCRGSYRDELLKFEKLHADELCETCQERLEKNPLRVLDCKDEHCQEVLRDAPKIANFICDDCKAHYEDVKRMLIAAKIKYSEDSHLVRGLDYYTRTVFEIRSNLVGASDALAGGGRYDGLVADLGGNDAPGFGFALGYERALIALKNKGLEFEPARACNYFVASVDGSCRAKAFDIAQLLRTSGVVAELDHQNRSLKSQFKLADKLQAQRTVIVGPDEIANNQVTIRDMQTHEQTTIDMDKIFAYIHGEKNN